MKKILYKNVYKPTRHAIFKLKHKCMNEECPVKEGNTKEPYKCNDCPLVKKSIELFGVNVLGVE